MKDLLLGFKLVRFGAKYKMFVVTSIIYFAIGFIFEVGNKGASSIGYIYLQIVSGMLTASALSIESADFFLASPKMKKLQTVVPAFMFFVLNTIAFILVVAVKFMYIEKGLDPALAARSLICGSLFLIITLLYYAVSYKLMLVATIVFFAVAFPGIIILMNGAILDRLGITFDFGMWPAVAISYALLIVAVFAYYFMARALYKLPFSKYAFRGVLGAK